MYTHPSLTQFQQSCQKTLENLHQEFSKLQTGRANASIVEHVSVEAYGQRMDIKSIASISVVDARSLTIQPWDKSVLSAIEKALQQANLGTNPVNDGVLIRINFPPMTEERRASLKKVVGQLTEQSKIRIRLDRQIANDAVKQLADEDEKSRLQKELQKQVDDWNAKVESAAKQKEQEVMTV